MQLCHFLVILIIQIVFLFYITSAFILLMVIQYHLIKCIINSLRMIFSSFHCPLFYTQIININNNIVSDGKIKRQIQQKLHLMHHQESSLPVLSSLLSTPTKSCDLGLSTERLKKYFPPDPNINIKYNATPKYELVNIGKLNKIFEPSWRTQQRIENEGKNQELISMFLKKNEQIAASLMKEKKSMSDIGYSVGKQSRYNRYSQDANNQNIRTIVTQENKVKALDKLHLLPKINRVTPSSIKSIQSQQTEAVVITDKKLIHVTQVNKDKKNDSYQQQPAYSQVTNINIRRFLKLKQHTYEIEEKNNVEHFSLKKKKILSHKKRMAKKQKQQLRNSLQAYLETKIVPKEQKYQSLKVSIKNHPILQKKEERQNDNDKTQIEKRQQQTIVNTNEDNKNPNKVNNRSLPRKVGVNAKISKKNLFYQLNALDGDASIYDYKIKNFRQFLFILKMTHNVFDPLILSDQQIKNQSKYKYFVGRGNNRQLIKALMKRRFWWIETDEISEAHFVWTQLKVNSLYEKQRRSERIAGEFYQVQDTQTLQSQKNDKKAIKQQNKKNSNIYKASFPENQLMKIMTLKQYQLYESYLNQMEMFNVNPDKLQIFQSRKRYFPSLSTQEEETRLGRVHNHLQNNFYIGNKKALYYNLKKYCKLSGKQLFDIVPLTFHIDEEGINSESYKQFLKYFRLYKQKKDCKNVWIVKPGQNSNRGNGISVIDEVYELNKIINSQASSKTPHTYIIQKYLEKPLLYRGRKFDIRHYMLATKLYGKMRLYFYGEGYVRTSSSDFDLSQISDVQVHLTNDAIQKYSESYGKYEQGNKISYTELQRYLDALYPNRKYSLANEFYPKIKQIALDTFKACYLSMDTRNLLHNFEIFGLDFMIDSNFHVWLIQVNTNPCLQLSSNLLNRIIPNMVQNSLRLSIDPLFPPTCHYSNSVKHLVPDTSLQRLQYQLIFDQSRDGKQMEYMYKNQEVQGLNNVEQDQDTYDNDGKQIDINIQ